MSKQGKSRKPLIIGIIAAVVILAALLAILLTNCVGQGGNEATTESTSNEVPTYQLYWNVDKAEYAGKSEAGMSSREPDEDGLFSVRFVLDGELLTLRVANRRLINTIDVNDVMGLEFDDKGVVVGVLSLDDMPLEKVGWQFYVQSTASKIIKLNSSEGMNGMEVLLEGVDPNRVWDMTGKSGEIGCVSQAIELDKVMAVQNLAGEVTHVFIYERTNFMLTHEAYCEHCKQNVTWKEWVRADKAPNKDGHYQLHTDIVSNVQVKIDEDAKLCLDLNGHRIDGKENLGRLYSMFYPGATFAVMDTSEEQTGAIAAHGRGDQGMCVWARYGAFYLYSGTLDASDATSNIRGAALEIPANAFGYMYGGKITGGTASYKYNETTGKYSGGNGGNVVVGGKFVMHDGIIENGKGDPRIQMKDGNPSYSFGAGGNMYISGVFEMNGGIIRNGVSGNVGGNIYIAGSAEVNMNGGTISGGTITGKGKNGGNIYIGSTKAVFNLNGGSIVGGSSKNAAGVVYCNGTFNMRGGSISGGKIYDYTTGKLKAPGTHHNFFLVNGTLNMSGGKIAGGAQVIDTSVTDKNQCTVNLSGSAKIFGEEGERGLTVSGGGSGVKFKVGTMSKGAKIGIYTTIGVFTEPTKAANVDKFFSNIEGADVIHYNECLALGAAYCLCGASKGNDVALDQLTHKDGCTWKTEGDLLWQPYTGDHITKDSNVYLTKDMNVAQRTIGVAEKKNEETGEITQEQVANKLNLDLNGYTLSAAKVGTRVFYVMRGSSLVITDSGVGGTMKGMGHKDQSGVILMGGKTSVTMIDGTLTMEKGGTASSGGISQIPASGTFTIYNGTVSNGSSTQGGNFDVIGKLYIYNGKIVGGTATNVYNEKTGKTAYGTGGNLNVREKAQVLIAGNTQILDGECVPAKEGLARANGGNIAVGNGTTVTIRDNALISGGVSNNGGNIVVYGHLIVEGGTIRDGLTKNASGSITSGSGMNIAGIHKTAIVDIRGGQIAGGVYMNCYGTGEPNLKLSGAPVIDKSMTSEGVRKPAYSVDYRNGVLATDLENKIDVSGLTKGAKIGIYAYRHFGTKANTSIRDYFFSEVKGVNVSLLDGDLYLAEVYCLCGASKGNDTALDKLTHKLGCTWETEGELLWQPYLGGHFLQDGNYFLGDNYNNKYQTMVGQVEEKKDDEVTKEALSANINLDLNGKTWTSSARAFRVVNNSVLTITDSGKGGKIVASGNGDQSGVILMNHKTVINLIDGELTMAEGAPAASRAGVAEVDVNVTFNMYGGKLTNGVSKGVGGNLNVKGKFNMYGGEISGGKSNGTGGNINIETIGEALITGNSKIFDGECVLYKEDTARNNGGNICLNGKLTISGNTEIYGGKSNNGGNIVTYSHLIIKDNVKIYDGITTYKDNNTTPGSGMNISAISAGHIDIRGGQIAGGVYINCYGAGEPQVSLSGAPVIDKSLTSDGVRKPSSSLDYRNGKSAADPAVKIDVSGLTDGARIGIAAYDHFAVNANETIKGYFFSDISGTDVSLNGTDLRMGTFYCLCGASKGNNTALDQLTHKPGCTWETEGELKWQPYVDGGAITVSGNYFLTGTVERKTQIEVKNSAVVNLDLNGQTIRSTARAFRVYETGCLTITDSGTNGTVIANGTTDQSGIFLLTASKSLTLIDGTYYIHRDGTVDRTAARGGIAEITAGVTVRVYGGEIYGGKSNNNGGIFDVTGNATARGTLEIYGGTISAGTAAGTGGCIMVNQYGTVKISGGTITGGTSVNTKGGNIAVENGGILEISGNATIAGGVYVNSNNVKLSGNALTIDKGTTAQPYSLQVVADRTVDVKDLASGATVKVTADAGQAFAKNAAEAHLAFIKNDNGEDVLLESGKLYTSLYADITGCVCGMLNGQHLSYNANGTTVKCDETVHTWKPWTSKTDLPSTAGYYYLVNDVTLSEQTIIGADVKIDLNGKTVTATAEKLSGNQAIVVSNGGKLTITNSVRENGAVVGGLVNSNDRTLIYVDDSGAELNLWHVDIGCAVAVDSHGALFDVNKGTMNIYGDTNVHNGKVLTGYNAGNGKIRANGTLNMYSGTIRDGRCGSNKNGGNLQVEGTFNMYGGTITGGKKGDNTPAANGNIFASAVNNKTTSLNLFGGTIDGDVAVYYDVNNAKQSCPVVTLKGGIAVNNGDANGLYVMYKDNPVKVAGALTGKVTVTYKGSAAVTTAGVAFAEPVGEYTITAADAEKFASTTEGQIVTLGTDGKLYLALEPAKTGCICGQDTHVSGCTETSYEWKKWDKADSLPTETGNYYLTKDVTLTAAQAAVKGANIQLDLNGKTVTVPGNVAMYTVAENDGTAILVTDTTADAKGKIEYTGAISTGILELAAGNTGKLFRGTVVLDDTVTFDSFLSTGAISAANAAKISTKNGVQNVYVFPEELANASTEAERLYIGKIGCICGKPNGEHQIYKNAAGETVGCDKADHVWKATATLPTAAGYWYLTTDVQSTACIALTGNMKVVLDINGKNITTDTGNHMIYKPDGAGVELTITNTVRDAEGKTVGGILYSGIERAFYVTAGAVLNLYNVDLNMNSVSSASGGLIKLTGIMSIYGDTVIRNGYTGGTNRNGGNIQMDATATLNIFSGTIKDGRVTQNNGGGQGGNIQNSGGTINMYGGQIFGGKRVVSNVANPQTGGNLQVNFGSVLNMYSGTIDGDITGYTNNANSAVMKLKGDASITAGLTEKGYSPYKDKVIYVTGALTGQIYVSMTTAPTIAAPVLVAEGAEGYTITPADKAAFVSTQGYEIMLNGGKLYMVPDGTILGCECGGKAVGKDGHTCNDVVWTEWTSDTALPSTTGNYILTKNITGKGQVSLGSGKTVRVDLNGKNVHMDYTNADTIYDAFRTYRVDKGAVLTITDSSDKPGTFTSSKPAVGTVYKGTDGKTQAQFDASIQNGASGMLLWVYGGTATVYDGVFDGSNLEGAKSGLPIWLYPKDLGDGGVLTVYGGTFKGSTTTKSAGVIFAQKGSTLNIKGGTFDGGRLGGRGVDASGGVIYAEGTSSNGTIYTTNVNISGGTIQNGYAGNSGGNIAAYDYTKLTISGGIIQDGGIAGRSNHYGGNIRIYSNAELEMTGGTIKGGYKTKGNGKDAGWRHANLTTSGVFTMTGGKIEGRTFVNAGTANISGDAYIFGGNALSVNPAADLTIGALNSGAKLGFMCTATEFTSNSNWKNGTVAVATAGQGLTEDMVNNQMSIYVYEGTGTYSVVLENGELFYRANPG